MAIYRQPTPPATWGRPTVDRFLEQSGMQNTLCGQGVQTEATLLAHESCGYCQSIHREILAKDIEAYGEPV